MADAQQPQSSTAAIEAPEMTLEKLLSGVAPMVRAHIMSLEFGKLHDELFAKANIEENDRIAIFGVELEVFLGLVPIKDFYKKMWESLSWLTTDEPRSKQLAIEILGKVMLPARKYLGDVEGVLVELGGNATSFSKIEIKDRILPYDIAYVEVFRLIDPNEDYDEERRERLRLIMREQMSGAPIEECVRKYMRPMKLGGAEMEEDEANIFAAAVMQTMQYTNFIEPEPELVGAENDYDEEGENTASQTAAPRPPEYTPDQIRTIYNGSPEERQRITESVQKIASTPRGREKAIAIAFASASIKREPFDIVAALMYLAQDGTLLQIAQEDERYANQVTQELRATEHPVDPAQVTAEPAKARFMAAYLTNQLEKGAGFSRADAARFSLRIATLLKKNGWNVPDIAAFDPALGTFRFTVEV
jgi:sulfur carrier protein ThiS